MELHHDNTIMLWYQSGSIMYLYVSVSQSVTLSVYISVHPPIFVSVYLVIYMYLSIHAQLDYMKFYRGNTIGEVSNRQKFVKHCLHCQMTNLQIPNDAQLFLEIHQMPVDFISMDLIGSFKMVSVGNQYTLTVICMLTNYVMCIPLADQSADTQVSAYIRHIAVSEEKKNIF